MCLSVCSALEASKQSTATRGLKAAAHTADRTCLKSALDAMVALNSADATLRAGLKDEGLKNYDAVV